MSPQESALDRLTRYATEPEDDAPRAPQPGQGSGSLYQEEPNPEAVFKALDEDPAARLERRYSTVSGTEAFGKTGVAGMVPVVSGVSQALEMKSVWDAAKAFESGVATPEEVSELYEHLVYQTRASRSGFWHDFASISKELIPFMGEFALSGGTATAIKKGAAAGLKKTIGRAVLDATTEAAERSATRRLADRIGGGATHLALQTAVSPRMYASVYREALPEMGIVDSPDEGQRVGLILAGTTDSFLEALPAGYTDFLIENASERSGAALRSMQVGLMSRWLKKNPGKTAEDFLERTLRAGGWHGYFEEIGEELLGETMRAAVGLKEWDEVIPEMDEFAAMAAAFGLIPAGQAVLRKALPTLPEAPGETPGPEAQPPAGGPEGGEAPGGSTESPDPGAASGTAVAETPDAPAVPADGGEDRGHVDRFLEANRAGKQGLTDEEVEGARVRAPQTPSETWMAEFAAQSGTRLVLVDAGRTMPTAPAYHPGGAGVVVMDANSSSAERAEALLFHELWHELGQGGTESAGREEVYDSEMARLEGTVPEWLNFWEQTYAQRFQARTGTELGADIADADQRAAFRREEAAANLAENIPGFLRQAITDPDGLAELARAVPGSLQRLRDAVVRLLNRVLRLSLPLSKRARLEELHAEIAATPFEQEQDPAQLAQTAQILARGLRRLQDLASPTELPGEAEAGAAPVDSRTDAGSDPQPDAPPGEGTANRDAPSPSDADGDGARGQESAEPEEPAIIDEPVSAEEAEALQRQPEHHREQVADAEADREQRRRVADKAIERSEEVVGEEEEGLLPDWPKGLEVPGYGTVVASWGDARLQNVTILDEEGRRYTFINRELKGLRDALRGEDLPPGYGIGGSGGPGVNLLYPSGASRPFPTEESARKRAWEKFEADQAKKRDTQPVTASESADSGTSEPSGPTSDAEPEGDGSEGAPETQDFDRALSILEQEVTTRLLAGEDLGTKKKAEALYDAAGLARGDLSGAELRQADEAIEHGVVRAARQFVAVGREDEADQADVYRGLVALYGRRPKMSARTADTIALQQFSTPVPLGYLASRLAGVHPTTADRQGPIVYEPTAGHGALLLDTSNAHANELDPNRRDALDQLPLVQVTSEDAATYDPPGVFAAVLTNPPFGKRFVDADERERWPIRAGAESFETGEIDHAVAWKALDQMHPDGRAVLIVGGPHSRLNDMGRRRAYRSSRAVQFWKAVYWHYNVQDHFTVEGKLYDRQGSAWPVDVVVIHGRKPRPAQPAEDALQLPGVEPPPIYSSWTSLEEKLDGTEDVLVGPRGLPVAAGGGDAAPGDGPAPQGDVAGAAGRAGGRSPASGRDAGSDTGGAPGSGSRGEPDAGASAEPGDGVGDAGAGVERAGDGSGTTGLAGGGAAEQPSGEDSGTAGDAGDVAGTPADGAADLDAIVNAAIEDAFKDQTPAEGAPSAEDVQRAADELRDMFALRSVGGEAPGMERAQKALARFEKQGPDLYEARVRSEQTSRITGEPVLEDTLQVVRTQASPDAPVFWEARVEVGNGGYSHAGDFGDPASAAQAALRWFTRNTMEAVNEDYQEFLEEADDETSALSIQPFDEEKYQKVAPKLRTIVEGRGILPTQFNEVATAIVEFLRDVQRFTKAQIVAMKEYIVRFAREYSQTDAETREETVELGEKVNKRSDVEEAENRHQVAYTPASDAQAIGTQIPTNQRQTVMATLEHLKSTVGDVDAFVAGKMGWTLEELVGTADAPGYLAAEQIDAVALAIANIDAGAGFIIGDQTGVGKGRFVATMIQYAQKRGLTPVFVTQRPKLYEDMFRDLEDTGYANPKPFATNEKLRGKHKIPLGEKDGKERFFQAPPAKTFWDAMAKMTESGQLEGGFDMVFTTYSQMQLIRKRGAPQSAEVERHKLLRSLAPNAFIIFDESHEAGGSEQKSARKSANDSLTRAQFARQLVAASHSVVYSSATYAKRPQVMTLYSKTDMALAVANINDLEQAIEVGGVPLQQVVSNMLVGAGQYLRRERSYDGVEFGYETVDASVEQMNRVADTLREIYRFDREMEGVRDAFQNHIAKVGEGVYGDVAIGEAGLINNGFSSIMHNLVGQTLLASKVDKAADSAIASLERGEKPVLALSNTMGAFLDDYVREFNLAEGDSVADMTFNLEFLRYLDRSRRMTVKNSGGGPGSHVWIDDEWMNSNGFAGMLRRFHTVREAVENQDFSELPVSPIDRIRFRLEQAGYTVDEITGRSTTIEYTADGEAVLRRRESSDAAKGRAVQGFNGGTVDALILNQSGATGLSLHASEKATDQKPRSMFILQPEPNIDTFMQMLGRIHRTGQVHLPRYSLLVADLPAERRPAAKLLKKLGSLNANTSASKEGAIGFEGVIDFMNEHGDEIVAEILTEERDIADMLGVSVRPDAPNDGIASKTTGRLAVLSVAEQERILSRIEQEYAEHIANLDALGLNTLEAPILELDAVVTSAEPVTEDKRLQGGKVSDSPFARPAILETLDAKKLERPLPLTEVQDKVRETLATDPLTDVDETDNRSLGRERQARLQAFAGPINEAFETETAELEARQNRLAEAVAANVDKEGKKTGKPTKEQQKALDRVSQAREQVRSGRAWLFNFFTEYAHGQAVRMSVQVATGREGEPVTVSYGGMIADIRRKGRSRSALSASDYEVVIYTTQSQLPIRLPLSKIKGNAVSLSQITIPALGREIEYERAEGRQERHVVTGNILAGFPMFGKEGRIVFFRTRDGEARQGLLLRASVNPTQLMEEQPVTLTPDQVVPFMDSAGPRAEILTDDRVVSVRWRGDVYEIRARVRGYKPYVLNSRARGVTELTQPRGQRYWSGTVRTTEDLRKLLTIYAEEVGASFEAAEHRDVARKVRGDELAADGKSGPPTAFAMEAAYNEPSIGEGLTESRLELLRRRFQDYFVHIKKVVEDLGHVPDSENPYLKEELFLGRVGDRMERFQRREIEPLRDHLAKNGISFEDASMYVYAKGAIKRNAVMAERYPKKFGTESNPGSGMRTSVALDWIERYEGSDQAEAYGQVWERVQQINKQRRELLVSSGLEKRETIDKWEEIYGDEYVPLRHEMDSRSSQRTGSGYQVSGPESFKAKGRRSMADSPLGFVMIQMEESIIRAEKNRVMRSMLRLVRSNEDPLFWAAKPEEVDWQLEQDGEIRPQRRPVEDREVVVKEKGNEIRIAFADPLIPRALKRVGVERAGPVVDLLRRANAFLRAVNTKWDVEFLLTNILRDVQTAGLNLTSEEGRAFAGKVVNPKALRAATTAAYRGLRGVADSSEWGRWWDEYSAAGARVSWWRGNDLASIQKDMAESLKRAQGGRRSGREVLDSFSKWVDHTQGALENAARFSAYVTARKQGWSQEQAASLAKNLTVNFQRRGEWGILMDALYLFYNAGLQGTHRLLVALRNPRGRNVARGLIAAGLILDLMNRIAAPEGDDGENLYDAIPDHVKERYLIGWVPGTKTYLKFPMPYGWNLFGVLGQSAGAVLPSSMGGGGKRLTEATSHVWSTFTGSFIPLGGEEGLMKTLMPTFADPFYQHAVNETFYGAPIRPTPSPYGPPKPDSTLYWNSTPGWIVGVSEWLNEISGGSEVRPGSVDISPESIEHFGQFLTGGIGRTAGRTASTFEKILSGETAPFDGMPVIRRFIGSGAEPRYAADYYELIDQIQLLEMEFEHGKRRRDNSMISEARTNPLWRLRARAEANEKRLRVLRGHRDGSTTPEERGRFQDRISAIMSAFLREARGVDSAR